MATPKEDGRMIDIGVAYATSEEQVWHEFQVLEGTTIAQAIEQSGVLDEFPDINLSTQKVGIFGEIAELNDEVHEGDRVEIYRPIKIDPQLLEKKKYKLRRIESVVAKK